MNTQAYESELRELLWPLTKKDRDEAVSFYLESIADRIEDGASEADAVASMPSPEEAARSILASKGIHEETEEDFDEEYVFIPSSVEETEEFLSPLQRLKRRKLKALDWVILIITSPLWLTLGAIAFSLILALGIVLLALYLCAWILIGCIWIVGGTLVLATPITFLYIAWGIQIGNIPYSLVNLGYGLFAFGCGVWTLLGAYRVSKWFIAWQKRTISFSIQKDGEEKFHLFGGAKSSPNHPSDISNEVISDSNNSPRTVKRHKTFFRVCAILIVAGLFLAATGFLASGLDWRVFLTSLFDQGSFYLGGTKVSDPKALFLGDVLLF